MLTANSYPSADSASSYGISWCGGHVSGDGRDCPWHVDSENYSTNTIDTNVTLTTPQ